MIIAEIGVDMSRFPTPGHLVSWARFAPGVKESAGKKKGKGTTGHGNPYLARVLGCHLDLVLDPVEDAEPAGGGMTRSCGSGLAM